MKRDMKLRKLWFILFAGALCACGGRDKDSGFVKTDSGFEFKHCTENGTAPKAKVGDILLGELEIRLNDTLTLSSNFGSPDRLFKIGDARPGSIDEFLLNMHIGDSAIMIAPADSVAQYVGGLVGRPGDKIYFYLKIHQIISKKELSEHDIELRERYREEDSVLAAFVAAKYPKAEKKSSGLYVLSASASGGTQAEFGKTVFVNYTVSDINGKVYDTNVKENARKAGIYNPNQIYKPFEFILGDDGLISGWTEGISYMHKGERSKILIPSYLAYGEGGFGLIAPYTSLIFDLELVNVE